MLKVITARKRTRIRTLSPLQLCLASLLRTACFRCCACLTAGLREPPSLSSVVPPPSSASCFGLTVTRRRSASKPVMPSSKPRPTRTQRLKPSFLCFYGHGLVVKLPVSFGRQPRDLAVEPSVPNRLDIDRCNHSRPTLSRRAVASCCGRCQNAATLAAGRRALRVAPSLLTESPRGLSRLASSASAAESRPQPPNTAQLLCQLAVTKSPRLHRALSRSARDPASGSPPLLSRFWREPFPQPPSHHLRDKPPWRVDPLRDESPFALNIHLWPARCFCITTSA